MKEQPQNPKPLFLVQPHTNSLSSISHVPLPQTYALGNARHFHQTGRKRKGENEKYQEKPTEMLDVRQQRERNVREK